MNTDLRTFKFADQRPGHLNLPRDDRAPGWRAVLRAPWLLRVLAAGAVIGLVLAFYAVVTQAVHQSALRQQAIAAQAQAASRCASLAPASARRSCLLDLAALQPVAVSLPGPVSR